MKSKTIRGSVALAAAIAISLSGVGAVSADQSGRSKVPTAGPVSWTANGSHIDENGDRILDSVDCEISEGDYYLTFVLSSAKGISQASINLGQSYDADLGEYYFDGTYQSMTRASGTSKTASSFKYTVTLDEIISLDDLLNGQISGLGSGVAATYVGSGKPVLTISHGCLDDEVEIIGAGISTLIQANYDNSSEKTLDCGEVGSDLECEAYRDANISADVDNDGLIHGFAADLFNMSAFPFFSGIPYDTFDKTKLTAAALYSANDSLITGMTVILTDVLIVFATDDTFDTSSLVYALGPDQLLQADYIQVTYDGQNYKYYLVAQGD